MKHVPGPDFPTGGIIIGQDNLKQGYSKGRGSIKIRGEIDEETLKNVLVLSTFHLIYIVLLN